MKVQCIIRKVKCYTLVAKTWRNALRQQRRPQEKKKALELSRALSVGNTGFEPATPTLSR